jgi:hypothetical protein
MPDSQMFDEKAGTAWKALQSRFATHLLEDQIDYLFARYVLGLTSPSHSGSDPFTHLRACRTILGLQLPPDRIEVVLNTIPRSSESWVEKAFDTIEELGIRDGQALLEHSHANRTNSQSEGRGTASPNELDTPQGE